MSRRTLADRSADQLIRLESNLPHTMIVRVAGLGLAFAAAVLHYAYEAPDFAWLSGVALALTALADPASGVVLALVAAVFHATADIAIGDAWAGAAVVRGLGLLAASLAGAGTSRLIDRYHETHRRSRDEDSITGLLNVRAFYDGLSALTADERHYAILLADIAGMRNLNERYGHPTGTEAMRALGHVLRRSTKGDDLVARLGSDEVAVALVGADREGALAAAHRLARLLAEETVSLPDGQTFKVHAHYGIATSERLPDEVSLLRAADHAKLAAKLHGPDEIGVANDPDDADVFHAIQPEPPTAGPTPRAVWA